jgi:hypothetical protein
LESSLSITRTTQGFPTPNFTDPAVKFGDGIFEAFNSAGGSVMQAYGNLFQERENISYDTAAHVFKAGFEVRQNVDTTYFGLQPNGEYDFGGGAAYATEAIPSVSGKHDIRVGNPLPDTLSGFLSGSPFAYIVAVAPPEISGGQHMGPAAINRGAYNLYLEDTWKATPNLTLDYGVRREYYTPITERADRTGAFRVVNGKTEYTVNPQPGYSTTRNGWGPRVQVSWAPLKNFTAHAGGAVTVIQPNIWQDNMLTGSTPFANYPRRQSSSSAPLAYGFTITPSMLPTAYDLKGSDILSKGTKNIPANTPMDVDRYEKDLANVTSSGAVKLSTARANRQDYFGMGDANAGAYFSIPIHIAAGTGPNQGRFGTLGRDTFRGPAYYDCDFALIKDTPFGRRSSGAERMDLQFRGEFFNLFNIVNMGLPTNTLTGSGFGEISKTAGTSRQIQLSLKIIY